GQFIDRIGVKLGLAFPAGPHLEALAKTSELSGGQENLPIVCRPNGVSFAGPETALTKWIQAGRNSSDIAAAAQWIVARTLGRMIEREALATGLQDVLLVGGVMSNQFIRSYIEGFLMKRRLSLRLFFAKPEFSSDHALGAAFFASLRHSL
ncbi:MAG: O-sialoglycoprotein endopeptidase, partial [Sporomusaceae bacterium]|nr:O-sialoglycoprotein endopeptidase [Sporomusaceae bacterium]